MLAVGESIRIPKKRGLILLKSIYENCGEILSRDYLVL
jgi:hypothetical protein